MYSEPRLQAVIEKNPLLPYQCHCIVKRDKTGKTAEGAQRRGCTHLCGSQMQNTTKNKKDPKRGLIWFDMTQPKFDNCTAILGMPQQLKSQQLECTYQGDEAHKLMSDSQSKPVKPSAQVHTKPPLPSSPHEPPLAQGKESHESARWRGES